MRIFLTVGSTFFNELVEAVLSPSVLRSLSNKGFKSLVIQCGTYQFKSRANNGNSAEELWNWTEQGIEIEAWRYKPTLKDDFEAADLIISHAGSGTILDVLRLGKPMIVVPNPSLLDNHQNDLASELDKLGHLKACTTQTLARDIETFAMNGLVPFPPMDQSKFRDILDEEMGFL